MTNQCISPVSVRILATVPVDRLQKAVNALVDASLTVTLTRQTEAEIRALVKNSGGTDYGVTLTASDTFCSCPDALYRGAICKHAAAVALFVLRRSAIPSQNSTPQHPVPLGAQLKPAPDEGASTAGATPATALVPADPVPVLRATRFEVVNAQGQVCAELGTDDEAHTRLCLYGTDGNTCIELGFDAGEIPSLAFATDNVQLNLGLWEKEGPFVVLSDVHGIDRLTLKVSADGTLLIATYDEMGHETWRAPINQGQKEPGGQQTP
jgi:hypothetical protein